MGFLSVTQRHNIFCFHLNFHKLVVFLEHPCGNFYQPCPQLNSFVGRVLR
ncbi:hypothetical protein HanXRQr2_Chr11g0512161 [Helianthus annuus]|uniref:Uncharacterized protein n=1 Tax=Helianthus annuus TaxID=4232 RepID=A0A9K3HTE0_HELAN|nr:hypothetical protein HanXRQr2_Chr11g0512161 [Helianthus annuus]KAJ0876881.1 hypothetical protein HanPSC8_Chr11g0493541 [Helianthus annuus]